MFRAVHMVASAVSKPIRMMDDSWKYFKCPIVVGGSFLYGIWYQDQHTVMYDSEFVLDQLIVILMFTGFWSSFAFGALSMEWILSNKYDGGIILGVTNIFSRFLWSLCWCCNSCRQLRAFFAPIGLLWLVLVAVVWFIVGVVSMTAWAVYGLTSLIYGFEKQTYLK